ncbi:hypothetical protein FPV67DRAFT_1713451 [Lyophyllum atratum]|nr:hypothetical protein FPV67DRAFT_1713451 [Lyophyllum atratum]
MALAVQLEQDPDSQIKATVIGAGPVATVKTMYPLSIHASRGALKPPPLGPDSDDERPLSTLQQKKQPSLLNVNFDNLLSRSQGDDDDKPLGLRVPRLAPSLHANSQAGDDDDRPLALHPEQQRRFTIHMIAQQQQQQQFVMQAQMQNSMYFPPPSMMGSAVLWFSNDANDGASPYSYTFSSSDA